MVVPGRSDVRGIIALALGCAALTFACGGTTDSHSDTGAGGAGTGGSMTGAGGAVADTSSPSGAGGAPQATGGTTTPAAEGGAQGSGGSVGTGGTLADGGRTGTRPGAGGATSTTSAGGLGGQGTGTNDGSVGGSKDGGPGGAGGTGSGGAGMGGSTGSASAVPSAGCGSSTWPKTDRYTITVAGKSREYILTIPDNYDPNHPYRLIFGFHGAKYTDDWVATGVAPDGGTPLSGPYFGLASEANGSAIFVAPQASGTWSSSDLEFVDAMLAQFEDQLCIDKSRVFSVGFSMGAIMTITIGCNRSEVFRGIAPMSGSLPSPCPTGQHIAYWASHGTNDPTINISNGQAARDEFVKRNHCGSQTSAPDANNCVTYQGCDQGYPVSWCTFPGVHEPAPFAGPEIWQFIAPL
jgi:polyhydroxybutyrate depolymerase